MDYDNDFWNKYADENESRYNEEFSREERIELEKQEDYDFKKILKNYN